MQRPSALATRLQEVLIDGRWIANTNYKEQLTGLSRQQAETSVEGLNSIAALTYHVNYYLSGILDVMQGGPLLIRDQFSFDRLPFRSDEDWKQLVGLFFSNAENFIAQFRRMDDAMMDQPFAEEKYGTWLRNIEGVIEHSYYHLGQIVLLRKLITRAG